MHIDLSITPIDTLESDRLMPLVEESEREGFRFLRRLIDETVQPATDAWRKLGVWRGGELLAVGGLTPDSYVQSERVGRLRHLYVRPEERSAGIGAALVAALEELADGRFDLIRLRTDTMRAARFYERLGYLPILGDATATHLRRLT